MGQKLSQGSSSVGEGGGVGKNSEKMTGVKTSKNSSSNSDSCASVPFSSLLPSSSVVIISRLYEDLPVGNRVSGVFAPGSSLGALKSELPLEDFVSLAEELFSLRGPEKCILRWIEFFGSPSEALDGALVLNGFEPLREPASTVKGTAGSSISRKKGQEKHIVVDLEQLEQLGQLGQLGEHLELGEHLGHLSKTREIDRQVDEMMSQFPLVHLLVTAGIKRRLGVEQAEFHLPVVPETSYFFDCSQPKNIRNLRNLPLFPLADSAFSCSRWTCLYSSVSDGLSFNRLLHSLASYSGPAVFFFQDEGTMTTFGAYVNTTLKDSPNFSGGGDSFLFSIGRSGPAKIFRPRNAQRNFFYLNSSARSKGFDGLPHGIGFGGGLEGGCRLWVGEDFEECWARGDGDLTYESGSLVGTKERDGSDGSDGLDSMCLSMSSNPFTLFNLEVFAVGGDREQERGLEERRMGREMANERIRKARKVDKAQFYEDLSSGLFESKAFQHKDQVDRSRT